MKRTLLCLALSVGSFGLLAALPSAPARADFPKPSLYPVSWDLKFVHGNAKRIVVETPGSQVPQAYWYVVYGVTNNTDKEQNFLPIFEMVTRDGKVIRSDRNIPAQVFETIKQREKNRFLLPAEKIAGTLLLGDDQAKEGVAIWVEPDTRMGTFNIYVGGLSGEIAEVKGSDGKPMKDKDGNAVILRKTLQLTYQVRGDEVYPGEDPVIQKDDEWVMR